MRPSWRLEIMWTVASDQGVTWRSSLESRVIISCRQYEGYEGTKVSSYAMLNWMEDFGCILKSGGWPGDCEDFGKQSQTWQWELITCLSTSDLGTIFCFSFIFLVTWLVASTRSIILSRSAITFFFDPPDHGLEHPFLVQLVLGPIVQCLQLLLPPPLVIHVINKRLFLLQSPCDTAINSLELVHNVVIPKLPFETEFMEKFTAPFFEILHAPFFVGVVLETLLGMTNWIRASLQTFYTLKKWISCDLCPFSNTLASYLMEFLIERTRLLSDCESSAPPVAVWQWHINDHITDSFFVIIANFRRFSHLVVGNKQSLGLEIILK